MIFAINEKDYTKYLQDDSYNVVQVDIGDSWTDANFKKHSNHVLKIQGSFEMAFVSDEEYSTFLYDVESSKNSEGYVVCELHILNLNITKQIDCFMDISSSKFRPVNGDKVVNIISININEA